jgi:hypothetical protein
MLFEPFVHVVDIYLIYNTDNFTIHALLLHLQKLLIYIFISALSEYHLKWHMKNSKSFAKYAICIALEYMYISEQLLLKILYLR